MRVAEVSGERIYFRLPYEVRDHLVARGLNERVYLVEVKRPSGAVRWWHAGLVEVPPGVDVRQIVESTIDVGEGTAFASSDDDVTAQRLNALAQACRNVNVAAVPGRMQEWFADASEAEWETATRMDNFDFVVGGDPAVVGGPYRAPSGEELAPREINAATRIVNEDYFHGAAPAIAAGLDRAPNEWDVRPAHVKQPEAATITTATPPASQVLEHPANLVTGTLAGAAYIGNGLENERAEYDLQSSSGPLGSALDAAAAGSSIARLCVLAGRIAMPLGYVLTILALSHVLGGPALLLAVFALPITAIFGPWYVVLTQSDWLPALLLDGGFLLLLSPALFVRPGRAND